MFVLWLTDEVHGHVFDNGHVFGPVSGAESSEVVVEDDVEDPVEAIFDAPVGAHGPGQGLCVEV